MQLAGNWWANALAIWANTDAKKNAVQAHGER